MAAQTMVPVSLPTCSTTAGSCRRPPSAREVSRKDTAGASSCRRGMALSNGASNTLPTGCSCTTTPSAAKRSRVVGRVGNADRCRSPRCRPPPKPCRLTRKSGATQSLKLILKRVRRHGSGASGITWCRKEIGRRPSWFVRSTFLGSPERRLDASQLCRITPNWTRCPSRSAITARSGSSIMAQAARRRQGTRASRSRRRSALSLGKSSRLWRHGTATVIRTAQRSMDSRRIARRRSHPALQQR